MAKKLKTWGITFTVMVVLAGCTTDDPLTRSTVVATPVDSACSATILIDTTWADTLKLSYDEPAPVVLRTDSVTPADASTAASR